MFYVQAQHLLVRAAIITFKKKTQKEISFVVGVVGSLDANLNMYFSYKMTGRYLLLSSPVIL